MESILQYNQFLIDSHTHILDYTEQELPIILQQAYQTGVRYIVCNTTSLQEFNKLQHFAIKYQIYGVLKSFGIHPYKVFTLKQKQTQNWIQKLQQKIQESEGNLVGEVGLDFRKQILQKNQKQLQFQVFEQQMNIAVKYNRPVSVHCVRAHGEMLKYFKKLNKQIKQQVNIIMHSYGGSKQITKSLLKLERLKIYFSLSLKRNEELCSVIPLQRLLLQTDSPYQLNKQLINLWDNKFEKYEFLKNDRNEIKFLKANSVLSEYYGINKHSFLGQIWKNSLLAFKILIKK